ncbi:hypothetical protein [Parabacteroides pacaensis]|uniref:hypothetical protein n=1 Tax=Parabacteroides pacaensis TaxID=2086575 RepID=UPI000D0E9A9C|nr:hypothetical protein [Parabacteroides pacaensis]
MKINIDNPILSVEFRKTTKYDDIQKLNSQMGTFFYNKLYLDKVEEYSIGLICVSPGFDEFFRPKRPKYYEDKILKVKGLPGPEEIHFKHHFFFELKLDYTTFFPSNKEEGYHIIAQSLLKFLEELKYPSAIKNFAKRRFINDMKDFFVQIGCVTSND